LFFGQNGLATIDVSGTSLTAKNLFVQDDGTFVVVATTADGLRAYALTAAGQPVPTFAITGELQIPMADGTAAGTMSAHRVADGKFIVIAAETPAASGALRVTRYLPTGVIDDGYGLNGREVSRNLGPGLGYTGVATVLPDERIVVVLADAGATRALLILDSAGIVDSANSGRPVMPASLQGKTITRVAPLAASAFVAVAVSGSGSAQSTELVRFDPEAHLDTRFGTAGILAVSVAASGGGISISDLYETLDNDLVLTGSSNNGLVVARYREFGAIDTVFNDGKGAATIADPGARATIGVTSLQESNSRVVTIGYAVPYGATATGASPTRAFVVSTIAGKPELEYGGAQGILNLFGRQAPASEFVERVQVLADGRILVLSATGLGDGLIGTLSRFLADGSPDPTWGTNGRKSFPLSGRCEWPLAMAVQADGAVLVLGTNYNTIDCGSSAMYGKRFGPTGNAEPGFQLIYSGTKQRGRSGAMALQPDGRIVVTGQDDEAMVVARYMPTGFLDPAFATGGSLLFQPNAGDEIKGGAVLIRPDQKVLVAGSANGVQLVLLQLNGDGTRDTQFGSNGVVLVSVPGSFLEVQGIATTPAGDILVLARSGQRALVAQFHANGAPDTLFGASGQLLLPLYTQVPQYSHFGLAIEPDGGILVSGQSSPEATSAAAIVRVTPTGFIDSTFGTGGVQSLRPSIYYQAAANDIALTPSGALYMGGFGIPGAFLARFGAAIVPAHVLEFYNTNLNHYFITADPAEQAGIDAGAAGPGWSRTGIGFRAFTQATGIPAGQTPVCRFYGSTAIDPATGLRRGPNSHFYTAQAAECAQVQLDPGWMLEGFAFYVRLPDATGQCANPLVPVYRNYNNRAQFNDSNHRYTTDAAIYATMQSLGWVPEGIVFCGAP
jgi:uncharacterized delta-60 repeat protein